MAPDLRQLTGCYGKQIWQQGATVFWDEMIELYFNGVAIQKEELLSITKGVFPWGKEHESDRKEESSVPRRWDRHGGGLWIASSETLGSEWGNGKAAGVGAATGQEPSLPNCQARCRGLFLQKISQFAACGPLGDHRIIARAPWIHSRLSSLHLQAHVTWVCTHNVTAKKAPCSRGRRHKGRKAFTLNSSVWSPQTECCALRGPDLESRFNCENVLPVQAGKCEQFGCPGHLLQCFYDMLHDWINSFFWQIHKFALGSQARSMCSH